MTASPFCFFLKCPLSFCSKFSCMIGTMGMVNKIIYQMNQSSESEAYISQLEDIFNRAKPRARYISELHVEEETNSISKQIVNGDIEVRRKRGNLDLPHEKNGYDEFLRKKFVDQFNKEKEQLQHRLGYVENSLVHLEKYDYLKRRSSAGKLDESRSGEWKKEHYEEMKKLERMKKEMAEKSKEKEMEVQELRAKIQQEEKAKKNSVLIDSIKKVKERTQKRAETVKQQTIKLKELLGRKELYQKLSEQYQQKEETVLEQRKKKLAEIRQLKQPINLQQILEHEQKVLQILKDKELMRSRQIRMNSSRSRAYKPSYQSAFYRQLVGPQEEEGEENPKHKLEKMRQFSEQVKSKYPPQIDEHKRRQMEDRLEQEIRKSQLREEKDKQLLQKPKLKGLQYLELVKKMPKKKEDSRYNGHQTDRIPYKNYLGSVSVDMGKPMPWNTILSKGQNKIQTAQFMKFQSQKLEQKLKWKQLQSRVSKVKDNGSIDQQYYQMVKAKLSLLSKE